MFACVRPGAKARRLKVCTDSPMQSSRSRVGHGSHGIFQGPVSSVPESAGDKRPHTAGLHAAHCLARRRCRNFRRRATAGFDRFRHCRLGSAPRAETKKSRSRQSSSSPASRPYTAGLRHTLQGLASSPTFRRHATAEFDRFRHCRLVSATQAETTDVSLLPDLATYRNRLPIYVMRCARVS